MMHIQIIRFIRRLQIVFSVVLFEIFLFGFGINILWHYRHDIIHQTIDWRDSFYCRVYVFTVQFAIVCVYIYLFVKLCICTFSLTITLIDLFCLFLLHLKTLTFCLFYIKITWRDKRGIIIFTIISVLYFQTSGRSSRASPVETSGSE